MATRRLADTVDAVARVYDGVAPPVVPDVFAGGPTMSWSATCPVPVMRG